MRPSLGAVLLGVLVLGAAGAGQAEVAIKTFRVPDGAHPHDVAPGLDGVVWYTAQHQGALGRLDPKTGEGKQIPLGRGSSSHGAFVGPDGAAWITDSGLNAMVRVDHKSHAVKVYPLPEGSGYANLNTVAFDGQGRVWFTGQRGIYGGLDPRTKDWRAWKLPGKDPRAYAVYVDERDKVWLSDFGDNAMVRFDPETGKFDVFKSPRRGAAVRQILGRPGEVWAPESGTDTIVLYAYK